MEHYGGLYPSILHVSHMHCYFKQFNNIVQRRSAVWKACVKQLGTLKKIVLLTILISVLSLFPHDRMLKQKNVTEEIY
jgi:hypothetical protein